MAHSHDHGPHDHSHDHEHAHGDHSHAHEHAHGDHSHAHAHAHGEAHDHPHEAAPSNTPLARGAGAGKTLFLDAPSGLAGDMIVAALVDLGVPSSAILEAIAKLGVAGFHVHVGTRTKNAIVATSFDVHVETDQPERTYRDVRTLIERAELAPGVTSRALAILKRLAEAEAKIHRMPLEDVHLHEVGGIDAIVDIVSSAVAIDYLGAELVVSPLPMGRGFVRAAHGVLPLPAPATVECLAGLPTYDGGLEFEFVTPTGAAIVGALASGAERWPSMAPERVGWGAGTANLRDRANVLRAVLGSRTKGADADEGGHVLLEANLDDMSGELAGHAIAQLLNAGAVDAWVTPTTMKKGRPGFTLHALAKSAAKGPVARAFLEETTTIGIRTTTFERVERPRRMVTVATPFGPVPVKVSEGPYGAPLAKPEFDTCALLAKEHGVAVRDVIQSALTAFAHA